MYKEFCYILLLLFCCYSLEEGYSGQNPLIIQSILISAIVYALRVGDVAEAYSSCLRVKLHTEQVASESQSCFEGERTTGHTHSLWTV